MRNRKEEREERRAENEEEKGGEKERMWRRKKKTGRGEGKRKRRKGQKSTRGMAANGVGGRTVLPRKRKSTDKLVSSFATDTKRWARGGCQLCWR
jgi:hypothetical protein